VLKRGAVRVVSGLKVVFGAFSDSISRAFLSLGTSELTSEVSVVE